MQKKFISYFRVSTKTQGQSGLGLQAQQSSVAAFTAGGVVLDSFTEVETGTSKRERPELAKAIRRAKQTGATLIVAKLDRLARSVSFVSSLLDSGVDFIAADNSAANKLTIHILSAVAEAEAEAISSRTKAALAAAKARGQVLGTPANLTKQAKQRGRTLGTAAVKAKAKQAYAHLIETIQTLRNAGASLQAIADRLNTDGERTVRGAMFSKTHVSRILARG